MLGAGVGAGREEDGQTKQMPSRAPMENLKKVTSVIYIAALVHGDGASTMSATIPAQLHRARETRVEISEVSRLAWRKHKSCQ